MPSIKQIQLKGGELPITQIIEIKKAKVEHYLNIDSRSFDDINEFFAAVRRAEWIEQNADIWKRLNM